MDSWLGELGAQRFAPLGLGDENVAESQNGSLEADFDHWTEGVLHLLKDDETKKKSGGCGSGNDCCSKKKNKKKVTNKKGKKNLKVEEYDVTVDSDSDGGEPVVDLEDLGSMNLVKRETANGEGESEDEEEIPVNGEVREMLTPLLRESLTKQGYRLIGTHSGVKLCRWTKVFFTINQILFYLIYLIKCEYFRLCCVVEAVAISIRFMESKVIVVWRLRRVLRVPINASFAGGIIGKLLLSNLLVASF